MVGERGHTEQGVGERKQPVAGSWKTPTSSREDRGTGRLKAVPALGVDCNFREFGSSESNPRQGSGLWATAESQGLGSGVTPAGLTRFHYVQGT